MANLIAFSGLPGVGKSTIARVLARQLGAVYVRVDSIEVALRDSVLRIDRAEDAGYRAAMAVARDNLRHDLDVVADAVNPVEITRVSWAKVASSCNARLLNVEVVCSDRAEHRRRVETRKSDAGDPNTPDWERVRTRPYEEWRAERLRVDTSDLSVEACVTKIIEAIEGLEGPDANPA